MFTQLNIIQQVEARLPRSEKLRGMVRQGIPHSVRGQMWLRLSGALDKKQKSDLSYKDVVKASSSDHLMTSKQIEKVYSYMGNICQQVLFNYFDFCFIRETLMNESVTVTCY